MKSHRPLLYHCHNVNQPLGSYIIKRALFIWGAGTVAHIIFNWFTTSNYYKDNFRSKNIKSTLDRLYESTL